MVRFGAKSTPRNWFSRREQRRLLIYLAVLGLVIFLASEAGNPRRWEWLWVFTGATDRAVADQEVDTRLKLPSAETEIPGTFRIVAEAKRTDAPANDSETDDLGRHRFPGVKQAYLDTVVDGATFRSSGKDAWFHLLALLDKTPAGELEKASRGPTSFVQMFNQPKFYRGELVSTSGTLRRAWPLNAPKNDYGIESYYQIWMNPHDNPSNPLVLYSLDLPEGFPTGRDLAEEVEATGFFYKLWTYSAKDTVRLAPVMLTKNVTWHPEPLQPTAESEREIPVWMPIVGALALAAFFVVIVLLQTRGRKPVRSERTSNGE